MPVRKPRTVSESRPWAIACRAPRALWAASGKESRAALRQASSSAGTSRPSAARPTISALVARTGYDLAPAFYAMLAPALALGTLLTLRESAFRPLDVS